MGRQRQQASPSVMWASLPLEVAQLVLKHLPADDRRAVAHTCRVGWQWVRSARSSFRVTIRSQNDLTIACSSLAGAATSLTLLGVSQVQGGPAPLVLSARCMALPLVESLVLEDISLHPRFLSYLATGLPRLATLYLACRTDKPAHRINRDGCLGDLAACTQLRALTVVNLQTDWGLDQLTQLTSLHLTLPDHAPNIDALPMSVVAGYICENCGALHEEDGSELLHAHTDWNDRVAVGRALRTLSGLRELAVDFRGECEEINCALNTLDLGPVPRLSSLTALTLRGASRTPGASARMLAHFNALPALRSLEVEFEGLTFNMHMWGLKDDAGRAVGAQFVRPKVWLLQRELAVVEE